MPHPSKYHLAQVNISKAIAPLDTPPLKGFVDRLDEINDLADKHPGFVWRLIGENNNATEFTWSEDPLIIVNMSVWETIDDFHQYVYHTSHVELLSQRSQWFEPLGSPHMAMWWVKKGHTPSIAEAKKRLQHIEQHGPTPFAFTFKQSFLPQD